MSNDNPLSATLKALREIQPEKSKRIARIIFSDEFLEIILAEYFESKELGDAIYVDNNSFDSIPFTVSELLENRWALVMSDGTLRFSNDGEDE